MSQYKHLWNVILYMRIDFTLQSYYCFVSKLKLINLIFFDSSSLLKQNPKLEVMCFQVGCLNDGHVGITDDRKWEETKVKWPLTLK